ncbi:MAG: hypothetical protein IKW64_00020 [Clostridia bacterium]|nr:hypothetical protein [Clostridia bacterium]
MKKFISIALVISILLITMSITPIASDMSTLPSNVTLKSIVCNKDGNTVTAKMTFNSILDCTVIMAVYDNNSSELLIAAYSDSPATATDFSISLSGYQNYLNCPVKIFFWDNLDTLRPVNTVLEGTVEPIPSNLAVIKDVFKASDSDGNSTWLISYLFDGYSLTAETTPEVATGLMPTEGDIVKISLNKQGLISSIKYVWDFDLGVRNLTSNEPKPLATGDNAYTISNPDETLAGGVVTTFDDAKDIATIDGTEYNLPQARNVYIIDNTGRSLTIKNSVGSSFKYFPDLYNTV